MTGEADCATLDPKAAGACETYRVLLQTALGAEDPSGLFGRLRPHFQQCRACADYLEDRIQSRRLLSDIAGEPGPEADDACRTLLDLRKRPAAVPSRIVCDDRGSVVVLRISGDLDEDILHEFRRVLVRCLARRRRRIIMDFRDARYMSYMALGVLIERLRYTRSLGGDIVLAGINLYVERLLRMTGVSSLITVYASEAEARSHWDPPAAAPAS